MQGLGHLLTPKSPDQGTLGANLNLWSVLASKSWCLDIRTEILSSNPHDLKNATQLSVLVDDTVTLKDCAEMGIRSALHTCSNFRKRVADEEIDSVLICFDQDKKLIDNNGRFIFDSDINTGLRPIAMVDKISQNLGHSCKGNKGSKIRWRALCKAFFAGRAYINVNQFIKI